MVARASGQTPEAFGATGVTSVSFTFNQNVVSGNAILAVGTVAAAGRTVTFSDNLANVYRTDALASRGTSDTAATGSCKKLTTGGSCQLTMTISGAAARCGVVGMEYEGVGDGLVEHRIVGNSADVSVTSLNSGKLPHLGFRNAVLLIGVKDGGTGIPWTWGSGFSVLAEDTTGRISSADRIVTFRDAFAATATPSASSQWTSVLTAYVADRTRLVRRAQRYYEGDDPVSRFPTELSIKGWW